MQRNITFLQYPPNMKELALKYGCNPNQKPSRIYMTEGELPIEVLNGRPGYINFLDALNSWQLVKELKEATGLAAAASFKHVSPAGAAIGLPLSDTLKKIYFVDDINIELSPIACAYARARGADRMSSYGDFVALSDTCDVATATLIKREVSDGVIAPDFTPEALDILKAKRKGTYNVIKIDPTYRPAPIEHKQVFGVTFEQGRNEVNLSDPALFANIPTQNKTFTPEATRDLIISLITLKYTVELGMLCERRTSHWHRSWTAEPHPLYPFGWQQGRHLVVAPAPQGDEPALYRWHTPRRPRQHHRRLHLRRSRRRAARWHMAAVLQRKARSAHP